MKSGVVVVVVCSSHIDEQLLPFKNIGETTKKHTSAKVEHFESLLEIRLEKKKKTTMLAKSLEDCVTWRRGVLLYPPDIFFFKLLHFVPAKVYEVLTLSQAKWPTFNMNYHI